MSARARCGRYVAGAGRPGSASLGGRRRAAAGRVGAVPPPLQADLEPAGLEHHLGQHGRGPLLVQVRVDTRLRGVPGEELLRRRQRDDLGERQGGLDLTGRLQAADARQAKVHQDHVGLQLQRQRDPGGPVGSLADDLDALRLQQLADQAAVVVVVLDQQDAGRRLVRIGHGAPLAGWDARKQSWKPLRASTFPPSALRRRAYNGSPGGGLGQSTYGNCSILRGTATRARSRYAFPG